MAELFTVAVPVSGAGPGMMSAISVLPGGNMRLPFGSPLDPLASISIEISATASVASEKCVMRSRELPLLTTGDVSLAFRPYCVNLCNSASGQ